MYGSVSTIYGNSLTVFILFRCHPEGGIINYSQDLRNLSIICPPACSVFAATCKIHSSCPAVTASLPSHPLTFLPHLFLLSLISSVACTPAVSLCSLSYCVLCLHRRFPAFCFTCLSPLFGTSLPVLIFLLGYELMYPLPICLTLGCASGSKIWLFTKSALGKSVLVAEYHREGRAVFF